MPRQTYHRIQRLDREKLLGQKAFVIWFTGLSGSGKTTVAINLERELYRRGYLTFILDGDTVRKTLNRELSYSRRDRLENIRRNGRIAKMFVDSGVIVLCAFVSGIRAGRKKLKALFKPGQFVEVFLDCPLAVCQNRDPKKLYQKAHKGLMKHVIGIDIPYEPPEGADVVLDTSRLSLQECVNVLVQYLFRKKYLSGHGV